MCWRPSDWLNVLFCRWVDRRRHFWKPSSTLSIFIHCHCHWSFVSILQWFLLSSAISALTVFVTRFSFLWCQLSWSTRLFLSFTTDHWRRITESVVSASAPKQRVYVQVRSPLAAVVVMIGAKEEVRWSYKRGPWWKHHILTQATTVCFQFPTDSKLSFNAWPRSFPNPNWVVIIVTMTMKVL